MPTPRWLSHQVARLRGAIGGPHESDPRRLLNGDDRPAVVHDRAVFSLYCTAFGLPVPRLLGIADRRGGGRSASGRPLRDLPDWLAFLAEEAPDEIVVAPGCRRAGRPARALVRRGARWTAPPGGETDVAAVWTERLADPESPAFVVEERPRTHPEIERLGGGGSRHHLRVVSLVERSGDVRIVSATPTLDAPIELDAVPGSRAACDLVRRAAPRFLPLRSLAWEIALTPDGPVIVGAET